MTEGGVKASKKSSRREKRPEFFPTPLNFPDRYDETYFVLMNVDPWALFAYWEIHEHDLERAQAQLACKSSMVVRVYDVTDIVFDGGNAHGWFDVEVEGHAHNWYIYPDSDGSSYIADIGLRGEDERFVVLARSNCAQMPRKNPGHLADEVWMEVQNDPRKNYILPRRQVGPPPEQAGDADAKHLSHHDLDPEKLMNTIDRLDIIDYYRKLWKAAEDTEAPNKRPRV